MANLSRSKILHKRRNPFTKVGAKYDVDFTDPEIGTFRVGRFDSADEVMSIMRHIRKDEPKLKVKVKKIELPNG